MRGMILASFSNSESENDTATEDDSDDDNNSYQLDDQTVQKLLGGSSNPNNAKC